MMLNMVHANLNSFLAGGQLGTHVKPISSYLSKEILMDGDARQSGKNKKNGTLLF